MFDKQLFLMAVIGALGDYADSEINNGNIISANSSFIVTTQVQTVYSFLNPSEVIGYQIVYLVIDRVNKTTYPFIAVGSSVQEVKDMALRTGESLFNSSSGVMGTSNNPLRMITKNILINNMDTKIIELTNGKTRVDVFGDIDCIESKISEILTESYREISNIINANGLNPSNIYQTTLTDPNTGTVLMNGQFVLNSGLIGTINNVYYYPQGGGFNYSIYFTFSYNLQRAAKNDLLKF